MGKNLSRGERALRLLRVQLALYLFNSGVILFQRPYSSSDREIKTKERTIHAHHTKQHEMI
ncbi:MAG: hypothetical protein AUG51_21130 [Acidobacteria bacterium 13_1_20CM_3_53_8]|nr:MAG: hypothetical protein AUG51_21130 [Acidobacteria bacterium 13_1_20CM_3_53_8]